MIMSKKCLFLGLLLAFAPMLFAFSPVSSVIESVEGNTAYIAKNANLKEGASGIVIRDFGTSQAIIKRAVVTSVTNDASSSTKLELKDFTALAQSALPDLNISAQAGDRVIMNYFYDRGLIIAPDKESTELVKTFYRDIYFIDTDIFGAYLIRDSKIAPQKRHLQKFCADNGAGVLAFVLKEQIKIVDCFEFSLLDETQISPRTDSPAKPFYSRLTGYRQSLYGFFTEEIILDYYQFYEDLLSGKEAPDILDKIIGR